MNVAKNAPPLLSGPAGTSFPGTEPWISEPTVNSFYRDYFFEGVATVRVRNLQTKQTLPVSVCTAVCVCEENIDAKTLRSGLNISLRTPNQQRDLRGGSGLVIVPRPSSVVWDLFRVKTSSSADPARTSISLRSQR